MLAFIRRANVALEKWYNDCDALHRTLLPCGPDGSALISISDQSLAENPSLRVLLKSEFYYAKLWLVCIALRGASWETMSFELRELAVQAKDAALNCLSTFLNSTEYRCESSAQYLSSIITSGTGPCFLTLCMTLSSCSPFLDFSF